MRNRDQCAPIHTDGYRSAGQPAISTASAGQGPGASTRPSCEVPVGVSRVPCMGESRSWPVVGHAPAQHGL